MNIKFLTYLIGCLFTLTLYCNETLNILNKIPDEDRKSLEQLFYGLMIKDNLGYTLFGDKPISLSGEFISFENDLKTYLNSLAFWNNWKIWEKYQHHFPMKNYLFIKEPSITVSNVTNLIFINKKSFILKVNEHLDFFKNKLGEYISGEILLAKIEKERKFASIIRNDEILWGVLLGYGLHNAKFYNRKYQLEQFILADEMPKIPLKKPIQKPNFRSIEEEYQFLDSKIVFFGEYGYSPIIQGSLNFVADSEHNETKKLEKKYKEARGKIAKIYAKKDFLETTLLKLTE